MLSFLICFPIWNSHPGTSNFNLSLTSSFITSLCLLLSFLLIYFDGLLSSEFALRSPFAFQPSDWCCLKDHHHPSPSADCALFTAFQMSALQFYIPNVYGLSANNSSTLIFKKLPKVWMFGYLASQVYRVYNRITNSLFLFLLLFLIGKCRSGLEIPCSSVVKSPILYWYLCP